MCLGIPLPLPLPRQITSLRRNWCYNDGAGPGAGVMNHLGFVKGEKNGSRLIHS
jgi:hypothetical protein